MLRLFLAGLLFSVVTLSAQAPVSAARVLFIGNSLTSVNKVPAMVEVLSMLDRRPLKAEMVARNDFSLEDHWKLSDAARRISGGGWTTVVLQQGPSALPESRVLLIEYVKKFDTEIRKAGARTALYSVWPSNGRRGDFPGATESYRAAADSVGGLLLPVGDAWQAVWRRDPAFPLYSPDGLHASPAASFLAAVVIYQGITGRTLEPSPALFKAFGDLGLNEVTVKLLLAAANDVRSAK